MAGNVSSVPGHRRNEMEATNDPEFALEIALGPAASNLVSQTPGKGIQFKKKYFNEIKRYLFKGAHLSRDDYRIYDAQTGKMIMYSHHPGKDPFDSLDPLGMGHNSTQSTYIYNQRPGQHNVPLHQKIGIMPSGEWEAHCDVRGTHGYPSFKIRPKSFSRHGRQLLTTFDGDTFMNICKQSKFKTMSIRQGFEISAGDSSDPVYTTKVDLAQRTIVVYNEADEEVMFVKKSNKTLVLNAAFGVGSETVIDIAPGCDVTAMLAIIFGIKQVGEHYLKDALGNYVMDPAKDAAVDSASGFIEQNFGEFGKMGVHLLKKGSRQGVVMAREYQKFHRMFYS
eukprot:Plantae.Rhodophyta-Purpureofilum_apyrenoidigerum.ctg16611.p1 GENE.Plantae.Rhodophyta-Purpureofilum_apyrenoidigerum.ctg16611~~Plantae.Rhodophyta-Purpureofilum_apyrenoidigerum.ctg16611.p1  ORF type:complete len:353 (-),score=62.44 Plantae.Rhodophyta-Purpureofilum_apyrenoidigerum.ctg16611:322-1332(-)